MPQLKSKLYNRAFLLAKITICYNIVEGVISVFFGIKGETISLFGFGLDSFVEVISAVGILHMIYRLNQGSNIERDKFEQQALKITGISFYLLAFGLIVTALINLYQNNTPTSTFCGIIVSSISILSMYFLIYYKKEVGKKLSSDAILADANCTKACLYLSVVLLISSIGCEFTQIEGLDSIGAIIIACFAFKEGRESFLKARGIDCSCRH